MAELFPPDNSPTMATVVGLMEIPDFDRPWYTYKMETLLQTVRFTNDLSWEVKDNDHEEERPDLDSFPDGRLCLTLRGENKSNHEPHTSLV